MIRRDQQHDESSITRTFAIERLRDDTKKTTVYRVSLSSENPVRDWPWAPPNVLMHTARAVDLSGYEERGLPLYANHQLGNLRALIGRIMGLKLVERRLVGELRFSEANPEAGMFRGMVDEGTITDTSITAVPIEREKIEDESGNVTAIRWTKWRPAEGSLVGVGADQAVGVGRSDEHKHLRSSNDAGTLRDDDATSSQTVTRGNAAMSDAELLATPDDKLNEEQLRRKKQLQTEAAQRSRVENAGRSTDEQFAIEAEKRRVEGIRRLAQLPGLGVSDDVVQRWIQGGYSVDQVGDNICKIFEERGKTNPQSKTLIGMTGAETGRYSLSRAILAAHSGDWKDAGLELEAHNAIAKATNRVPQRGAFYVPLEVQRRDLPTAVVGEMLAQRFPHLRRDLNVATAGQGGFLVQTSVQGFDELLRNISFAFRMGVTRLGGLRDNITIPRQSAAGTAAWLASETATASESTQTFVQLSLTPKTIAAYTEISRLLLLQSSIDAEGLVNADLAAICALAVDAAVLNGSGSAGQPSGLDNASGLGSVSGTSLAAAGILEFQTDVATANVMPVRGGYVTTPAVAGLLMARPELPSTGTERLWKGNVWNGSLFDFPAMTTNQVASATMYFGDWSKIVLAEWGVLELDTNPYAGFTAGIIGVRAMYSIDVGVRYPAAFSRATTIN